MRTRFGCSISRLVAYDLPVRDREWESQQNTYARGETERMEDAREVRRNRLLERKTDRLAFITGQNRTLAQSAPQDGRHTVGDLLAIFFKILSFAISHFSLATMNMYKR